MSNFIPKGYHSLFDAFEAAGRRLFSGRWTGREVGARDHTLVATEAEVRAIPSQYKSWRDGRVHVSFQGDPEEIPELAPLRKRHLVLQKRADRVWNELRHLLYEGTVCAEVLNRDGSIVRVPCNAWIDDWQWDRNARENGCFVFDAAGGRVLLRAEAFRAAATGQAQQETPHSAAAIANCEKWLRSQRWDDPTAMAKTKDQWRTEARSLFRGLSGRGFDVAWKRAASEQAKKAGRRSKLSIQSAQ